MKPDSCAPPSVSIVIPCYKQAHYLDEVLQSVISQTFQDWECLIVNDGSPDRTNETALSFISTHPGYAIRVLEKPNGGLSSARNFGIVHSSGKYILPLDADDLIRPEMLARTVAALDSNPQAGVAYTQTQCFEKDNSLVQNQAFTLELLKEENHIAYCSLYRRELFDQIGGYNTNLDSYEDWDFWIGALERGWQGVYVPEPLFLYRVKDQSMYTEALKRHDRLIARIVLNHPEVYGPQATHAAQEFLKSLSRTSAD